MRHFIPTYDGQGIVALFDDGRGQTCSPWNRSIPEAESTLQKLRQDAWATCIDVWLEMSNDLSDALAYAAELRGEAEAKQSRAA